MIRNYKFRIYPSKSQIILLDNIIDLCRNLYNSCLQQRIEVYKNKKKSISRFDQSNELPELKRQLPEYKEIYAKALQDVVLRADRAFNNFFRRIRNRLEKPGFPRFKAKDRYHSFVYNQSGWKIEKNRIDLSKIGSMKIVRWKEIPSDAKIKQVIIKRESNQWFAILTVDGLVPNKLQPTGNVIGIDLGLKNLVTTSNGDVLGSLDPLKKQELRIRKLQTNLSRKKMRSRRRTKSKIEVSKAHRNLERARKYQLNCISKKLVKENDLIAIEDLDISNLSEQKALKGNLGKNVRRTFNQASFGELIRQLTYKAEEAGRSLVKVDPRGTSQKCSGCDKEVLKDLKVRVHSCPHCGLILNRDHNAAKNILKRALCANQEIDPEIQGHSNEEFALVNQVPVMGF